MRVLILLLLWPIAGWAQTTEVQPGQLALSVEVEAREHVPFTREMVLITIKGIYRRHITRETLVQPDLDGFSWSQLGPDRWYDERINGQKVKVLERRMAVYPDRAGDLTIGAFTHNLTLTDEGDDWFEHQIQSDPVTLRVAEAPATEGWWFPTKSLRVSDQWSNAPDQLAPGEGVLRVIRIEALGVTPEMIPPMPVLTSPSAMIFPHPEKRLVELSPSGPITYAFWRWTIRPTNATSAIVEPLEFSYFDTATRESRVVTISPQRVAFGTTVPSSQLTATVLAPTTLPGWRVAGVAGLVLLAGLWLSLAGRRLTGPGALRIHPWLDPLARRLQSEARAGKAQAMRRTAAQMLRRDGPKPANSRLLSTLDKRIFAPHPETPDLTEIAQAFAQDRRLG